MKVEKDSILIAVLIIFHLVGIIGLSIETYRELFLSLTPLNLLLTFVVLTWGNNDFSKQYLIAFAAIYLTGFWIEVAGVHSEMLFGSYRYGSPLGIKFLDVPLIIGVNWFLVSFASKGLASTLVKNKWNRILIASLLTVGIDFLIEPVAVELNFWQWQNNIIPIQNFVMWFLTALFIQWVLHSTVQTERRKICIGVYSVQLIFFAMLNLNL